MSKNKLLKTMLSSAAIVATGTASAQANPPVKKITLNGKEYSTTNPNLQLSNMTPNAFGISVVAVAGLLGVPYEKGSPMEMSYRDDIKQAGTGLHVNNVNEFLDKVNIMISEEESALIIDQSNKNPAWGSTEDQVYETKISRSFYDGALVYQGLIKQNNELMEDIIRLNPEVLTPNQIEQASLLLGEIHESSKELQVNMNTSLFGSFAHGSFNFGKSVTYNVLNNFGKDKFALHEQDSKKDAQFETASKNIEENVAKAHKNPVEQNLKEQFEQRAGQTVAEGQKSTQDRAPVSYEGILQSRLPKKGDDVTMQVSKSKEFKLRLHDILEEPKGPSDKVKEAVQEKTNGPKGPK